MELDGSLPYFQNVTASCHRIYAELFTAQWLLIVFVPPDGLSNVPCTLPTEYLLHIILTIIRL
jgi:hypothetical protein